MSFIDASTLSYYVHGLVHFLYKGHQNRLGVLYLIVKAETEGTN